jgi:glyoxylase-like metal-dependent hydrolase (beta-lactamase superfamily II)
MRAVCGHSSILTAFIAVTAVTVVTMVASWPARAFAQDSDPTAELIERVADAMGGSRAILDVHTLEADGYGMEAYFWGGGNVSGDPDAPQKWAENPNAASIWDFDNDRYLTRYRHNFLFPFGGIFGHSFSLSTWGIDGDVGYTGAGAADARRLPEWTTNGSWFKPDGRVFRALESLTHPLAAVRAVLDGDAAIANLRVEEDYEVVDLVIDEGALTMGIDPMTALPRWIRWTLPHQNLGELTMTTTFVGYQNWDGVQLPLSWSSRIDWRDTLIQTRMLDGYYINSMHTPDIAAPESVLSQPLPPASAPAAPITVTAVADGIWHLNPGGHTIIEFADHLVIFELGGSVAQTRAVIELANSLVPGKPLTHLIVSHHHFDHTSGFRAAIEAGLTVISHRGNEQILREMAARPAPNFGDMVALPGGGTFDFVPVDGHLRLQDSQMTLDVYAVVKHNHMANAVFAYAPKSRTFIEGDLATPANQFSFWAEAYEDNLEYYGLDVAMVSPNHVAAPMTHKETIEWIRQGVPAALARCEQFDELGRNLPGCPPYIYRDWDSR